MNTGQETRDALIRKVDGVLKYCDRYDGVADSRETHNLIMMTSTIRRFRLFLMENDYKGAIASARSLRDMVLMSGGIIPTAPQGVLDDFLETDDRAASNWRLANELVEGVQALVDARGP